MKLVHLMIACNCIVNMSNAVVHISVSVALTSMEIIITSVSNGRKEEVMKERTYVCSNKCFF